MKTNMGTNDRIIIILMASLIITLFFTDVIESSPATSLLIIAGSFVFTALACICPVYRLFNISICGHTEHEH